MLKPRPRPPLYTFTLFFRGNVIGGEGENVCRGKITMRGARGRRASTENKAARTYWYGPPGKYIRLGMRREVGITNHLPSGATSHSLLKVKRLL